MDKKIIFVPYLVEDENIKVGIHVTKNKENKIIKKFICIDFYDLDFTGEKTIKHFFEKNIESRYYSSNIDIKNLFLEDIVINENEYLFLYFYEMEKDNVLNYDDSFENIKIRFVDLNNVEVDKDIIYFSVFNKFFLKAIK
jgi:hypothetical protein